MLCKIKYGFNILKGFLLPVVPSEVFLCQLLRACIIAFIMFPCLIKAASFEFGEGIAKLNNGPLMLPIGVIHTLDGVHVNEFVFGQIQQNKDIIKGLLQLGGGSVEKLISSGSPGNPETDKSTGECTCKCEESGVNVAHENFFDLHKTCWNWILGFSLGINILFFIVLIFGR